MITHLLIVKYYSLCAQTYSHRLWGNVFLFTGWDHKHGCWVSSHTSKVLQKMHADFFFWQNGKSLIQSDLLTYSSLTECPKSFCVLVMFTKSVTQSYITPIYTLIHKWNSYQGHLQVQCLAQGHADWRSNHQPDLFDDLIYVSHGCPIFIQKSL